MANHLKSNLCAGSLVAFSAVSAGATEICVKCTGPDANYACIVNASAASMMDTAAKLYCITALAKSGPHASCAIDRNTKPPCQGERKELPVPSAIEGILGEPSPHGSGPAATAPAANASLSQQPGAPEQAPGAVTNAPPKTVQEMVEKSAQSAGNGIAQTQKSAGDAAKSAGTALEKAGAAVGNAAKTSWKCLSSFFSNC